MTLKEEYFLILRTKFMLKITFTFRKQKIITKDRGLEKDHKHPKKIGYLLRQDKVIKKLILSTVVQDGVEHNNLR